MLLLITFLKLNAFNRLPLIIVPAYQALSVQPAGYQHIVIMAGRLLKWVVYVAVCFRLPRRVLQGVARWQTQTSELTVTKKILRVGCADNEAGRGSVHELKTNLESKLTPKTFDLLNVQVKS